jgi:hypothetical protein
LNGNRQATVELGEERILVRHGDDWLDLQRSGAQVKWLREDGRSGTLEFTHAGQLRGDISDDTVQSDASAEEMDMAAERWARELMQ